MAEPLRSIPADANPPALRRLRRPRPGAVDPGLDLLAHLMDDFVRVPGLGWRVGLDPLIGLLPGVGDIVGTAVSLYIFAVATRYRIPRATLARMGLNIALDALVGTVPIVGELFDAWWKANQRNLELVRRSMSATPIQARRNRAADLLFVGVVMLVVLVVLIGAVAGAAYLISLLVNRG